MYKKGASKPIDYSYVYRKQTKEEFPFSGPSAAQEKDAFSQRGRQIEPRGVFFKPAKHQEPISEPSRISKIRFMEPEKEPDWGKVPSSSTTCSDSEAESRRKRSSRARTQEKQADWVRRYSPRPRGQQFPAQRETIRRATHVQILPKVFETDFESSPSGSRHSSDPESSRSEHAIQVLRHRRRRRGAPARLLRKSLWQKCEEANVVMNPFAHALAGLRSVRQNYIALTNVFFSKNKKRWSWEEDWTERLHYRHSCSASANLPEDPYAALAWKTLNELDWCLGTIEAINDDESTADSIKSPLSQLGKEGLLKVLRMDLSRLSELQAPGYEKVGQFLYTTYFDSIDIAKMFSSGEPPNAGIFGIFETIGRTLSGEDFAGCGVETPHSNELEECLVDLDTWGMDIFKVTEYSNNRPLTCVSYTVLQRRNLLKVFQITPKTLITYLTHVESCYRDMPYHNSIHAADVVQSTHVLLSAKILNNVFTDLEIFATLLAAVIHDVDHPGLTNQYLVNTSSDLALMYNDTSVLENHHLAVGFSLLHNENCDILANFSKTQRHSLRKMVIAIVLATDMSKFMRMLGDLKALSSGKKDTERGALQLDDDKDRVLVLENAVHCADLSNPTKPLEIYRCWVDRIMDEFFRQGDLEREQGMEVSPMCDRETAVVEKSQVGFIKFIAQPLWETWAELVSPSADHMLDTLDTNHEWYLSRIPDDQNMSTNAFLSSPSPSFTETEGEEEEEEKQNGRGRRQGNIHALSKRNGGRVSP